jgi:hypothetical protein
MLIVPFVNTCAVIVSQCSLLCGAPIRLYHPHIRALQHELITLNPYLLPSHTVTTTRHLYYSTQVNITSAMLADAGLAELIYLEKNYLQQQFTKVLLEGNAVISEEIAKAEDARQTLIYGFMAALPIIYLLVARPAIALLDNELKRTRGLLILVPQELLINLPDIRRFMATEFKDNH